MIKRERCWQSRVWFLNIFSLPAHSLVKQTSIVINLIKCRLLYSNFKQKRDNMKRHTLIFLVLTALTGLIGFIGISFTGIEMVRIMFLIFADLLIISILARFFFSGNKKMRLERIRK